MATEAQYAIFKSLYDEEADRYTALEARARLYLSIVSLYVGAIAFKAKEIHEFAREFDLDSRWFLAGGGVLVLSLLATVVAIQIRAFEGICDPEEVIDGFGKEPPTDEDFLDDRIVDLAVATNRNSNQNDRTAKSLSIAAYLLFLGVALHLAIFVAAVAK